jgi:transglutaminase-like putative cysteine protease
MRLPLGAEHDLIEDMGDGISDIDAAAVDWARVRRTAYVIHQRITYQYEGPVRRLHQRLLVQPRERHGDQRRLSRCVRVVDATPRRVLARADDFGNHVVDIEIPFVSEQVTFVSWCVVERNIDHLPHLAGAAVLADPRLLEPTLLTTADEALEAVAAELAATGLGAAELAWSACLRVFEEMTYRHDVTGVRTTAAEAYALRQGVCQDYAHVLLAITRALGIASRYVSGQMLGVGGSHAWVEVLVGDGGHARVISLDPTHGRVTGMTYLTIAVGRDYADVAPVSGSYASRHSGLLTVSKRVSVMSIEADGLTDAGAGPDSRLREAV